MAKIKGNSMLVYVDDVAIGCLNNNEFEVEGEEISVVCKDNDGAEEILPGGDKWGINFDGTFETTATKGLSVLLGLKKNKTIVGLRMGVAGSGGLYIQGSAYLINIRVNAPVNGVVTYSGRFKGSGTWNYGTHT
jgi:hypothetical protein